MRISAVRLSVIATMVVGAVAIGSLLLPGAKAQNGGEKGLTGSWEAVAIFNNPPQGFPPAAQLTETYFADGNILLTPNLPGVTPAQGNWVRVSSDTFQYTANFFSANPQGGLLTKSRVVGTLKLSDGANAYTTAAKLEALDGNNNVINTLTATVHGTRLAIVTN